MLDRAELELRSLPYDFNRWQVGHAAHVAVHLKDVEVHQTVE